MNKAISLLLCMLLLLTCGTAMAAQTVALPESSDAFRAELSLPEGATFENNLVQDGYSLCTVKQADLAEIHIAIAFDELVAGLSLADMTGEQLDEVAALAMDGSEVTYHRIDAENGQPYLAVEAMAGGVLNCYMTVHEGHIITLTQYRAEFEPLTEEDCGLMLRTLAGISLIAEP